MILFTNEITEELAANGKKEEYGNHVPVVKIFDSYGPSIWLVTESDPEAPNILVCLADLGFQCPEIGSVYRSELETMKNVVGLPLERDVDFHTTVPLMDWSKVSSKIGYIPRSEEELRNQAEIYGITLDG